MSLMTPDAKLAYKEAIFDTVIGTLIMFPLNLAIISVTMALSFSALQVTITSTGLLFIVAVVRKAIVRQQFEKTNEARRNTTRVVQRQSDRSN